MQIATVLFLFSAVLAGAAPAPEEVVADTVPISNYVNTSTNKNAVFASKFLVSKFANK